MPSVPRKEIFDRAEVGVYHCYSRCVRQGHLCGFDYLTGTDYSHRKQWIDERVQELQEAMLIDVLATAILDNHFHATLRNRPDLVEQISDEEVAKRRYLCLPPGRDEDGKPREPTQAQIKAFVANKKQVKLWRERLSCISWYMRCLKEPIARRANSEDGVSGHFWEGRFHSVRLLDGIAVLMCCLYVDLNEIRAGVASTPEESKKSSIFHRIEAWKRARKARGQKHGKRMWSQCLRSTVEPAPDWLAPIDERSGVTAKGIRLTPDKPRFGQARPSNAGFLPVTVTQYFQMCDWAGRERKQGKRGSIPNDLAPIMDRLVSNSDTFLHAVQNFGRLFKRFCGSPKQIRDKLTEAGKQRIHGLKIAAAVYDSQ